MQGFTPLVGELSQSSRQEQGVVHINCGLVGRRMAYEMWGSQATGPRYWVSIYSVVKNPRRGKRQG
jgi:hypothetical protein